MTNKYSYGEWTIRNATTDDIAAIIDIWRQGLLEQGKVADESQLRNEILENDFQSQINSQTTDFKFWICLSRTNEIAGWQSILPFQVSPNPVIKNSFGQSSTYIRPQFQGKGLGKLLLKHALEYCKSNTNIKFVIGFVLDQNKKSLKMCDEIGFQRMGVLPINDKGQFPHFNLLIYET